MPNGQPPKYRSNIRPWTVGKCGHDAVHVVPEDCLAFTAANRDMIHGTFVFDPLGSGNAPFYRLRPRVGNPTILDFEGWPPIVPGALPGRVPIDSVNETSLPDAHCQEYPLSIAYIHESLTKTNVNRNQEEVLDAQVFGYILDAATRCIVFLHVVGKDSAITRILPANLLVFYLAVRIILDICYVDSMWFTK